MNTLKVNLRERMLEKRLKLPIKKQEVLSAILSSKLIRTDIFSNSKNVLVYLPVKAEVDTKFIINELSESKKKLNLVANHKKKWIICNFNVEDRLVNGPFNIPQPSKIRKTNIHDLDTIILPGLAFSEDGHRLGYGKGVYDKLLSTYKSIKVGICYDFQIIKKIPSDDHDIKMDLVVTEKRLLRFT